MGAGAADDSKTWGGGRIDRAAAHTCRDDLEAEGFTAATSTFAEHPNRRKVVWVFFFQLYTKFHASIT